MRSPVRHAMRVVTAASILAMLTALSPVTLGALPGDEPGTAIVASVGTTQYDSTDMTESGADPTACPDSEFGGPFTNTMWFSYAPARDSLTMIDVNSFVSDGSTDFLAILFVFARDGGQLDLVGCSAYPATVFIPAEAGTTYLIMVAGLSAADVDDDPALLDHGGTFDLTIQPIKGRIVVDRFVNSDTYVDEFLSQDCGTEITVSFSDRVTVKTFLTATGPREFVVHDVGWITFSGGGATLRDTFAQTFRDPFTGSVQVVGLANRLTLDGGGTFLFDAGKIVFGPDGDVTFEAGPHPTFDEGFDICAALGL